MNSERVKPRCWKTPVSRYWAKITSEGWRAEADPIAMPSSPAETLRVIRDWRGGWGGVVTYHVEAQAALSLSIEHDEIHYTDCYTKTPGQLLIIS